MAKYVSFAANKSQLVSAIAASTGVSDADKIVATNASGVIDPTLIPSTGISAELAIAYAVAL